MKKRLTTQRATDKPICILINSKTVHLFIQGLYFKISSRLLSYLKCQHLYEITPFNMFKPQDILHSSARKRSAESYLEPTKNYSTDIDNPHSSIDIFKSFQTIINLFNFSKILRGKPRSQKLQTSQYSSSFIPRVSRLGNQFVGDVFLHSEFLRSCIYGLDLYDLLTTVC